MRKSNISSPTCFPETPIKKTTPKVSKQRFRKKRVTLNFDDKNLQCFSNTQRKNIVEKHISEEFDTNVSHSAVLEQSLFVSNNTAQTTDNKLDCVPIQNLNSEQTSSSIYRDIKKQKHNDSSLSNKLEPKQSVSFKKSITYTESTNQHQLVKKETKIAPVDPEEAAKNNRILSQRKIMSFMTPRQDYVACGTPRFFVLDNNAYENTSSVDLTKSADSENSSLYCKFLVPLYGGLQPNQYILDLCPTPFPNKTQLPHRSSSTPKKNSANESCVSSEINSVGNTYVPDKSANDIFLEQQRYLYTTYMQPMASSYNSVVPPLIDFTRPLTNPSYSSNSSASAATIIVPSIGSTYLAPFQDAASDAFSPVVQKNSMHSNIQRKKKQKKIPCVDKAYTSTDVFFEEPTALPKIPSLDLPLEQVTKLNTVVSSEKKSVQSDDMSKNMLSSQELSQASATAITSNFNQCSSSSEEKVDQTKTTQGLKDVNKSQPLTAQPVEFLQNSGAVVLKKQDTNFVVTPPQTRQIETSSFLNHERCKSFDRRSTKRETPAQLPSDSYYSTDMSAVSDDKSKRHYLLKNIDSSSSKTKTQHCGETNKRLVLKTKNSNSSSAGYYTTNERDSNSKDVLENSTAFWTGGILVTDTPLSESKLEKFETTKTASSRQASHNSELNMALMQKTNENNKNYANNLEFSFDCSNIFGYNLFDDTKQRRKASTGANNESAALQQTQLNLCKKHVDDLWSARADVSEEVNGVSCFNGWAEPCFFKCGGGTWLSVPFV